MLNLSTYFIREHVGFLKLSDTYDILDPRTNVQVGIAKEKISTFKKLLRMWLGKMLLPTSIFIYEGSNHEDDSRLIFSIHRGVALFKPKVEIRDADGNHLGHLVAKAFSIGGAFYVHDDQGQQVAMVKGNWRGWDFRIIDNQERELGRVTKKWAGLGKELFTSADNYIVDLGGNSNPGKAVLFLAAGLAIDTVFKEKK